LSFTSELPHVICLSEHHLKDYEINTISLNEHILTSQYSRKNFRQGGVCIFIKKNIQFSKINNTIKCKEKDLELCVIQPHLLNVYIVCVYRAPSGDFLYFIQNL
jgi:exonuclease III